MKTPKAGEHWVWLPCDKHPVTQLRDLVVEGRDFEDQPEWAQKEQLEHMRCGCRYLAENPDEALAELRRHEAQYEADMRAKMAAILHPPEEKRSFMAPWLLVAILWAIAALIWFVISR